jgi:hypothetical protein
MRIARMAVVAALVAIPGWGLAQDQKTYKLTIGDVVVDIDPGESLDVTMPDGKQTTVKLELNDFASFSGSMFSFVHPAGVSVTKTQLDTTINQYLMASALGTLVIVQEYGSINPVSLNQLMLQELTRESIQAGAEMTQQPAKRKLADGRELTGLRATVKTRTDATDFEIMSFGSVDQGLVLVTRIDQENAPAEGAILDKFWESLKIKL